jgi:aryl-alcohol dehydrogenase-like predicted oxidoreductase
MLWDEERKIHRSLKGESVRRECEASLRRLGVEAIDLYQIHWPNPEAEIEEGWAELAKLKHEGKVRYIGVSNFNVEQMKRIQPISPIDSLQPPYSLINRKIEPEILPFCEANGIAVIVYSPMASGLLTGAMTKERVANFPSDDWRRRNPEYQEPKLSANLELAALLGKIGARHGVSAGEVAIAWTLKHSAVTGASVGGRDAKQVEEMIDAGTFRLSAEEVGEIEGFGG